MLSARSVALRALVPVLLLHACHPATRTAPATAESQASERAPFLWQVEKDGAVSHVFGTVHVGVGLSDLPSVVRTRLDASHTLIVESNTEDAASPELLAQLMLPADKSLRVMLGARYWSLLVEHLGDSLPAWALERLPPWQVQLLLQFDDPKAMAKQVSLDSQLVERARSQGKELHFLETAEFQFKLLARLIGIEELRETLDDVPKARRALRVLLRAYRMGNLPALTGLTLDPKELAEDPEQFELLLFGRNRTWMSTLSRELARGGVFVAVGAAHYVGDEGLLMLLQRAGFTVTRVSASAL